MGKTCSKCKKDKSVDDFGKKKYNADGLNHYCKECENRRSKEKYANPIHREKIKFNQIARNYGLNKEMYLQLFIDQNYCCKICKTHVKPLTRNAHVDHCHRTNKVRGILCKRCNYLLGFVDDNVTVLTASVEYLKLFSA